MTFTKMGTRYSLSSYLLEPSRGSCTRKIIQNRKAPQKAPLKVKELEAQKMFGNPLNNESSTSGTETVPFDPAAVIQQARGGRPRKWASDAERMAHKRAMKAKEPVTVQSLMTGLEKPPSRTVSPNLLQQRVREQENKCLLCQRRFGT